MRTTTINNVAHAAETAVATEQDRLAAIRGDAVRINQELLSNHEYMEQLQARTQELNKQLAENGRLEHAQQERVAKAELLAEAVRKLEIAPEEPSEPLSPVNPLGQPREFEEFQRDHTPADGVPVATGQHDTQHMQPVGEGQ